MFVVGCSGNSSTLTQPNGGPFTLTGSVADTLGRPIDGANVDVTDGARAGTSATTDAAGRFSMPGVFSDAKVTTTASKSGYITSTFVGTPLPPSYQGSTQTSWLYANFQLQSTTAPNVSGDYSLTLAPSSVCNTLLPDVGTRTYAATVKSTATPQSFVVTVNDAALAGSYNSFLIGVASDFAEVHINSGSAYDDAPGLVVPVGEKGYWAIFGRGGASTSAGSSGITVPFSGDIFYCPREKSHLNLLDGQHDWCEAAYVTCTAPNHMLTLTRR
jgi:hypothetical protein